MHIVFVFVVNWEGRPLKSRDTFEVIGYTEMILVTWSSTGQRDSHVADGLYCEFI